MATGTRAAMTRLEDLPNIGKSIAADLRGIGIRTPAQLVGKDPYALYAKLNRVTATRHDPCLLDTFIAVVRFVDGGPVLVAATQQIGPRPRPSPGQASPGRRSI